VHALNLAARDPRAPWLAKAVAILVAGYAHSPIDLIPDFIPVLGYLDDLIIVPLEIWIAGAICQMALVQLALSRPPVDCYPRTGERTWKR
jgi:uncharacterized membrane protein YkvA (DUF1232 family)